MKKLLERKTFSKSRLLDYCSEQELIKQTGFQPDLWPLVMCKELVDNALDACEETGMLPNIKVKVDENGISVRDNGPGLKPTTIEAMLDFTVRVSNREAYVAPDRGAQGNALKTIIAMPFVLDGKEGRTDIFTCGIHHQILFKIDQIRQEPRIEHHCQAGNVKNGALVKVHWPDSASTILMNLKGRFLQFAENYTWLNPHLKLTVDWFGDVTTIKPTSQSWKKWRPSDPTSSHWYQIENLERLIAANITHDEGRNCGLLISEFLSEFNGLSGSRKRKLILEETGLARKKLIHLTDGDKINTDKVRELLEAMRTHTKPVKPNKLGIIGKDHFEQRFREAACEMESFRYRKLAEVTDDLPWIIETAFGWCPEREELDEPRKLITGVNWSPGILNPFRELGKFGSSLDTILSQQRVEKDDPVIFVLHIACPRIEYTGYGKSEIVIRR